MIAAATQAELDALRREASRCRRLAGFVSEPLAAELEAIARSLEAEARQQLWGDYIEI